MKIKPDQIPIKASNADRPPLASFVDNNGEAEWQILTDYNDASSSTGSMTILKADGSVYRRTIDSQGFIISETLIRKGTSNV